MAPRRADERNITAQSCAMSRRSSAACASASHPHGPQAVTSRSSTSRRLSVSVTSALIGRACSDRIGARIDLSEPLRSTRARTDAAVIQRSCGPVQGPPPDREPLYRGDFSFVVGALDHAGAGAGRIKLHRRHVSVRRRPRVDRHKVGLDNAHARARRVGRPPAQHARAPRVPLAGDHEAPSSGEGGELCRLVAGRGAAVDHGLARPRLQRGRREARRLVLQVR